MSDLVVATAFTASGDEVSPLLKKQAKAADTFGGALTAAFRKAGKESSVFGSMLKANIVGSAITAGFSKIQSLASSTIDAYVDFDTAIAGAADSGAISLQRGTKEFELFAQTARDLAATTKYSATDAAEALGSLGEAGFDAGQAQLSLSQIAKFATGSNLELAKSADLVGDAMGAFRLKSTDAATQANNLEYSTDAMAFAMDTSKMDAEELANAIKSSGPAFGAAGQGMSTYLALLGKMTGSGMEATDAGSKLAMMMKGLAVPSKAAEQASKKLGISLYDQNGKTRDLIEYLADYQKATDSMTEAQRNAYTSSIFGKRGLDGVNSVLALGVDSLKEYRDEMDAAGGKAKEEAAVIEKTLGYKLDTLKNSATEFGMKLIEAFSEDGKDAIDQAVEALKTFDPKPIVAAAKGLLEAFKWLFGFIRDHQQTLKVMLGSWLALKAAMGAIKFGQQIAEIARVILKWQAVTVAAGEATAAQTAAGAAGGGAGGVAGAAGGVGIKGFLTQDVKKAGGATNAMAGIAALGIGVTIGTAIEESFLNPLREAGAALELETGNLIAKVSQRDVGAMSVPDLMGQMDTVKAQIAQRAAAPAISSIEDAFAQVNSGIASGAASVGSFFGFFTEQEAAAIVQTNQGPIDVQKAQIEALTYEYQRMALAVLQARLDIQAAATAATTEINVNVANAPAGTTVDAKGTAGAPKVNQAQAGRT